MILQGNVFGCHPNGLHQFATQERNSRFFFILLEIGVVLNVVVQELIQTKGDIMSLLWESDKNSTMKVIKLWMAFVGTHGKKNPWRLNLPAKAFQDEDFSFNLGVGVMSWEINQ